MSSPSAPAADQPLAPGFESELLAALPRIRGYVAALAAGGPGLQETDDLLQELAAKALRYRHAHDGQRPLIPWLRRAALHLVLDARRAANRGPRQPEAIDPDTIAVLPTATAHSERRDQLAILLARLEPLPRELLLRFHRDGQSVAQIAAALRLPEGTVKSHLHRARRCLREHKGASTA